MICSSVFFPASFTLKNFYALVDVSIFHILMMTEREKAGDKVCIIECLARDLCNHGAWKRINLSTRLMMRTMRAVCSRLNGVRGDEVNSINTFAKISGDAGSRG